MGKENGRKPIRKELIHAHRLEAVAGVERGMV